MFQLDPGVYQILNVINGKVYVGSAAVSFKKRWGEHATALRRNKHRNRHLQAAWNKYGEDKFEFSILERCPATQCITREQYWIDTLAATNPKTGYNLSPTAGSVLGLKKGPEAVENHTIANRAAANDPDREEKRIAALRETMKTKEWREANAAALRATVAGDPQKWSETSKKNALAQHRNPEMRKRHVKAVRNAVIRRQLKKLEG